MATADDSAVTGQAGEESPATVENKFKTAAQQIKGLALIPAMCQVYVLEYLSNFDDDAPEEWAQRFNVILEEYRDKKGFEFLTVEDEDGNKTYRTADPAKYENFKEAKESFFKESAATLRQNLFQAFDSYGLGSLNTLVENPNAVLLDNELAVYGPETGVSDVTTNSFNGAVSETVLNFPESTEINLQGLDIWTFLLFAYETGLYTKDYDTNGPGDIPGLYSAANITTSRFYRDCIIAKPAGAGGAESRTTWMPIYRVKGSGPQTELENITETNISDNEQYKDIFDYFPAATNDGKTKQLRRWTKKQIEDYISEIGLVSEVDSSPARYLSEDTLYYSIGNSFSLGTQGRFEDSPPFNTPAYQDIYNKCLQVIASMATLYSKTTLDQFKDVLIDLVDAAEDSPAADFFTGPDDTKKPKSATPAAPKALKAADHQCYLLENVRAISGAKEKLIKNAKQTYTNLGAINTTYNPGNIISVINHGGTDTTEEKDALINLCPEIYALLTPFIEVYRVEYKRDDQKKLRPVRHARIPFPNFIHPDDIDAITSGDYGRFAGAGIKSFTWSLDGVQPAEVDNNISAKLELHFQTIQDLFSLNEAQGAGAAQPGYLDLIIASPGVKESNNKNDEAEAPEAEKKLPPISTACFEAQMLSYDPRDFEIKVCAGWSLPPNFANIVSELEFARNHPPDYGEKLALAIQKSTTTLYLTLTDHELNFNENGSVDLNVFYQARLSGLTRSPAADIFASPSLFEDDIKDADKKIKELNKKKEKYLSDTNSTDINDRVLEGINKQLEEVLEDKAKIVKQDKAIKYRKFLDRLYCSNKIYSYTANQRKLLRDVESPRLRAARARGMTKTEEYTNGFNPQQTDGASDKLYADAAKTIGEIAGVRGDNEDDGAEDRATARRAIGKVKALEKARAAGNGDLEIPFFYLGDLIDEVVGHVGNLVNKSKGSLQILLSEVELLDPLQMYQIAQVKIPCPNDKSKEIVRAITDIDPMRYKDLSGISFTINIGSIPISLEFFQEWFINNVVKGQASKYNLLRFIKTVCSSLIAKAFNSICFEGGPQFSLRFDTATFNFDRSFAGEIVNVDTLAKSKTQAQMNDCGELNASKPQTVPAFVVSSMDSKPLTGDYIHDLRRGIYHYYLGASCGIAKSIKFNRTGIPYYREARLQRTSALSALQLREMYNVNIDMVGNTIHRNGQYIYVNPVAIGAGSLKTKGTLPNLARLLGIGGYYMVTGVSHTVSSAGFNVSLTGIQEGIDFSQAGTSIQLVPYDAPDGIVKVNKITVEPA